MALAQLAEQEVGPLVDAMAAHLGDPAWQEVLLLAVGYLGIVQRRDGAAGAVLEALIARVTEPPGEAVILAGRAVADMRAGGVTPGCRQKVINELVATLRSEKVVARRRVEAGFVLAELGDPRPEVMTLDGMEFCEIPAGLFRMGSETEDEMAYDNERPAHIVDLSYGYQIGRYPVTVAQFREYVEESGHQPGDSESLHGPANVPVVSVSWKEALACCRWLTLRWRDSGKIAPDWSVTLPSEAEWERAARGRDGLSYPWGNEADLEKANYDETGIFEPSTVGCFPLGASPSGCEEISGNVSEWTRSLYLAYPYDLKDGRESIEESTQVFWGLRGGSYFSNSRLARCACRYRDGPGLRNSNAGFRVVLSPFSSDL